MVDPTGIDEIKTAIDEISARVDLARKEGREADAAEMEQRIDGLRKRIDDRSPT
ncbi:hypothetical protein [Mycobacterium asiaticum]|uniref:hypothetical protein n=1 Tax=Mycobacterium asiaticum TaxID=1790 RepID=UPI000AA0E444|nr:hypothetical protein [Mycobacterium asiaticum]